MDVIRLQHLLVGLGHSVRVDGIYGPQTHAAVVEALSPVSAKGGFLALGVYNDLTGFIKNFEEKAEERIQTPKEGDLAAIKQYGSPNARITSGPTIDEIRSYLHKVAVDEGISPERFVKMIGFESANFNTGAGSGSGCLGLGQLSTGAVQQVIRDDPRLSELKPRGVIARLDTRPMDDRPSNRLTSEQRQALRENWKDNAIFAARYLKWSAAQMGVSVSSADVNSWVQAYAAYNLGVTAAKQFRDLIKGRTTAVSPAAFHAFKMQAAGLRTGGPENYFQNIARIAV